MGSLKLRVVLFNGSFKATFFKIISKPRFFYKPNKYESATRSETFLKMHRSVVKEINDFGHNYHLNG